MKHIAYILIAGLIIILGCYHADDGETLLRYQGTVSYQDYWWGVFDADSGTVLEIEFLSEHNLDVLLTDSAGFAGFKQRIGLEMIDLKDWYLEIEEFGTCTLAVQTLDSLCIYAGESYWDTLLNFVDIYLFDSTMYGLYLQGQNVYGYCNYFYILTVAFGYTPFVIKDLFLVIDNTSMHGSNPEGPDWYSAYIYRYTIQPFDYCAEGSALDTDSASILFDVPSKGTYFLVINNAGYVKNGATPAGHVDFTIEVKEP